ncbi:MAG: hypothetical protein WDM89_22265 [Rhizomicrobium sp.]
MDRATIEGVDLTNGSVAYESPVSISVGNGDFPNQLTASFNFRAAPTPGGDLAPTGPIPYTDPASGWTTNWHNKLSVSGSGMEAMGQSDIRELAGTLAAFYAEQDIFTTADATPKPTQSEIVAGVLTSAWWSHQLTGNVVTVAQGTSTHQFVKLATNAFIAPGAGFATLKQSGSRAYEQYICPTLTGSAPNLPNYSLSRGWDYTATSFNLTNAGGDAEHFAHCWRVMRPGRTVNRAAACRAGV